MNKMRVLVTGADGMLGSDVISELKRRKIDFCGCTSADFDITDEKKTRDYILSYKPDCVVHCAAYTDVDKAETDTDRCFQVNIIGTVYLRNVCKEIDAEMIFISTDYVFSGDKDGPYDENDEADPLNNYGLSKYLAESALMLGHNKAYVVRTSWLYGKHGRNFVKTMLKLSETNNEIDVVSDQIGSPTYTKDLAKLVVSMIGTGKYGMYHATNEGQCSWAEFAREIFRLTGKQVRVNDILSKDYIAAAKRPLNSVLSKEMLSESGFERLPDWKDALERFLITYE